VWLLSAAIPQLCDMLLSIMSINIFKVPKSLERLRPVKDKKDQLLKNCGFLFIKITSKDRND